MVKMFALMILLTKGEVYKFFAKGTRRRR